MRLKTRSSDGDNLLRVCSHARHGNIYDIFHRSGLVRDVLWLVILDRYLTNDTRFVAGNVRDNWEFYGGGTLTLVVLRARCLPL